MRRNSHCIQLTLLRLSPGSFLCLLLLLLLFPLLLLAVRCKDRIRNHKTRHRGCTSACPGPSPQAPSSHAFPPTTTDCVVSVLSCMVEKTKNTCSGIFCFFKKILGQVSPRLRVRDAEKKGPPCLVGKETRRYRRDRVAQADRVVPGHGVLPTPRALPVVYTKPHVCDQPQAPTDDRLRTRRAHTT